MPDAERIGLMVLEEPILAEIIKEKSVLERVLNAIVEAAYEKLKGKWVKVGDVVNVYSTDLKEKLGLSEEDIKRLGLEIVPVIVAEVYSVEGEKAEEFLVTPATKYYLVHYDKTLLMKIYTSKKKIYEGMNKDVLAKIELIGFPVNISSALFKLESKRPEEVLVTASNGRNHIIYYDNKGAKRIIITKSFEINGSWLIIPYNSIEYIIDINNENVFSKTEDISGIKIFIPDDYIVNISDPEDKNGSIPIYLLIFGGALALAYWLLRKRS